MPPCRLRKSRRCMIGTTHFTNAVVERRRLLEVAVLRLALPATAALPPFIDWPPDLRATLGGHTYMLPGGCEFDGRAIAPLGRSGFARGGRRHSRQRSALGGDHLGFLARGRVDGTARRRNPARRRAGCRDHAFARDRPRRIPGAGERGDHERLPRRPGAAGRDLVS